MKQILKLNLIVLAFSLNALAVEEFNKPIQSEDFKGVKLTFKQELPLKITDSKYSLRSKVAEAVKKGKSSVDLIYSGGIRTDDSNCRFYYRKTISVQETLNLINEPAELNKVQTTTLSKENAWEVSEVFTRKGVRGFTDSRLLTADLDPIDRLDFGPTNGTYMIISSDQNKIRVTCESLSLRTQDDLTATVIHNNFALHDVRMQTPSGMAFKSYNKATLTYHVVPDEKMDHYQPVRTEKVEKQQ